MPKCIIGDGDIVIHMPWCHEGSVCGYKQRTKKAINAEEQLAQLRFEVAQLRAELARGLLSRAAKEGAR